MQGTGVIDRFLDVFTRYIDGGFGLLHGEVAWLASTLIAVDVTLAALFWAWGADEDVLARLVKKTLFIGAFAFLISNWNALARVVFESFAGLGLKASGAGFTQADLLRPGRIAEVGLEAGMPILQSVGELMGFTSFFENFVQIAVLLFAWIVVLLAFFVLAIQLFVSLIEFKLVTLAGFVLVPFGLFNKTAFMAERVLGNVLSSGIKVLVLAVIVGIGSTLFGEFTRTFGGGVAGAQPTIEDAAGLVLASLSLLGLGIFGPGIANGIVSGGPQLGAGAAVGTGLAVGGAVLAGAGAAKLAGGAAVSAARGTASVAGGTSSAYQAGAAEGGGVTGGIKGVAQAGAAKVTSPLRPSAASGGTGSPGSISAGGSAASNTTAADTSSAPAGEPGWARRMRRGQTVKEGALLSAHALRSGDGGGGGGQVSVKETD